MTKLTVRDALTLLDSAGTPLTIGHMPVFEVEQVLGDEVELDFAHHPKDVRLTLADRIGRKMAARWRKRLAEWPQYRKVSTAVQVARARHYMDMILDGHDPLENKR